jgi:hypothetical protein
MSATGSVNLIVCFSFSHPFAPHLAENLQRLAHQSFAFISGRWLAHPPLRTTNDKRPTAHLPRRLRNSWNFAQQRELPETQAAHAELPQKCARTSASLASVVLARGKLGLLRVFNSFCCSCHSILH